MSPKKRHPIRSSEIRKMVEKLRPKLGDEIEDLLNGMVEKAELESEKELILIDREPAIIKENDDYLPLLNIADRLSLKRITVDMGAVAPISKGANIMAPGITGTDKNIEKGEIVGIEDEKNRKLIAIGRTLKKEPSLKGQEGKVIENLHHVGDRYWELKEEF